MRRSESRVTYESAPSVDQVVEQAGDQVLHPEGQAQRVELGLGVVAVHRRDAGRDVPLLVDVLDRRRRARAEDDGLQLLEDGEGGVEQTVAGVRPAGSFCQAARALAKRWRVARPQTQMAGDAVPTPSAESEYFWASSWWVRTMRATRR